MNKEKEEVEIDLIELWEKLCANKKFIIKCSIIGAIVGIVIAFSIPKEYTTAVILTTESNKSAGGSMGALASMAEINLGSGGNEDVFSPDLYPNVLNSTPFIKGLLNINVIDNNQNINMSLYNYLKDHQNYPWWTYILNAPKKAMSLFSVQDTTKVLKERHISSEDMEVIDKIRKSYTISTDKKTGVTSVEVRSQSPEISAFLVDTITSYLQLYIIEQRTKKSRTDLLSSQRLYDQAKTIYYDRQQNLASFVDANMNVISAKYRINQEKLQNEATIAYSVYNQMAQQVQMNKVKVQDNTPVFTIIQPAIIPLKAESPKRKIILIAFIVISALFAAIYTLKEDISSMIKQF